MKKQSFAGIVALATTLGAAHAAIVTDDATFTNKVVGGPGFNVVLDKFNPALGTLTKVELTLETTTANTNLIFDNEGSAGSAAFHLDTRIQAQTGVNLKSFATSDSSLSVASTVAADNDAAANFSGTDSLTLSGGLNSIGSFARNTTPYFNQFMSPPGTTQTVAITSSFTSPIALSSSGAGVSGVFNTPSQTFSGRVIVTYTYSPLAAIPEASTVFFGAALGLSLAFRRRRQQLA